MNNKILIVVLALSGCAANPTADNWFGEDEPLFPPRADLKQEIAACRGDQSCETAAIEQFRADEAWRAEAIGLYLGIKSQQYDRDMELFNRNADRASEGFRDQLRRIPAPGGNRDIDVYLHQ